MARRPTDEHGPPVAWRMVLALVGVVAGVVVVGAWLSGGGDGRRVPLQEVPGEVAVTLPAPPPSASPGETIAVVCSDMSQHRVPAPSAQVTPGDVVDFHGAPCIVARPDPTPSAGGSTG